jgi:transposase-like protein
LSRPWREDAERLAHAAQEGSVALGKSRRPRITGHGAKLPRRKEQAIAALLTQRTVAEAARTIGIGAQTLRRWMQDGDFNAEYAAAACAVFGPAMSLAQQRVGDASSIARNLAVDLTIPAETRRQAALYVNSVLSEFSAKVRNDGGRPYFFGK